MNRSCRLVLSLLLSALVVSCTTVPEAPSYTEIVGKYEALKQEGPKPMNFDFGAACNQDGMCIVPMENLKKAVEILDLMHEAQEKAIEGANLRLDALAHCEYAGALKDHALLQLESKADKMELNHSIKQGISFAGMIAGGILCVK